MRSSEVNFALLTPPGRGAVATIHVWGADGAALVDPLFRAANARPLAGQMLGQIVFGRWQGDHAEEVVVCRLGPDKLEIHCHGGLVPPQAIAADLQRRGAVQRSSQEWLAGAGVDPLSARALAALTLASTAKGAAVLLDQAQGALSRRVREVVSLLASAAADQAQQLLEQTCQWESLGQHLIHPFRVVLAGAPNVGKSSLINRLLGFERSIVYHQPGTTRDVVRAVTALDGWPVELIDTAGIRESNDPLETQGVAWANQQRRAADLTLWIEAVDGDARPEADQASDASSLHVLNKIDLLPSANRSNLRGLPVSARTGEGVEALQAAIVARLLPRVPAAGEAVPFDEASLAALQAASVSLRSADVAAAQRTLENLLN